MTTAVRVVPSTSTMKRRMGRERRRRKIPVRKVLLEKCSEHAACLHLNPNCLKPENKAVHKGIRVAYLLWRLTQYRNAYKMSVDLQQQGQLHQPRTSPISVPLGPSLQAATLVLQPCAHIKHIPV